MGESKLDLLQGTLDLMVLQTLAAMGSLHGYGIARRIEQISGDAVLLNQGTIYASLVRLQQRGWIAAEWGTSENNRKAKFYSITEGGRKQLAEDAAYWERLKSVVSRVLATQNEEGADDGQNRNVSPASINLRNETFLRRVAAAGVPPPSFFFPQRAARSGTE